MDSFLANVGLFAIAFLIVYSCKKIQDYYYFNQSSFYENEEVYNAADEFVHGGSAENVKAILTRCFDFTEEDAEEILAQASPHKKDKDGGYRVFIRYVNKVLGEHVYDEKHNTH